MYLLDRYGDRLTAEDYFLSDHVVENAAPSTQVISTAGQMLTGLLALVISVATGFIG